MSKDSQNDGMGLIIEIGKNGLWRFFDGGFRRWPYNKLAPLFSNRNLEEPRIQQELNRLETEGFIKIHKTDDCYLEVLNAPSI